jgi:serine/threonine-protein kinase
VEIRFMAATKSDDDLLLGILALQSGLIEASDLGAALRSWSQGRCGTIAQILVESGALSREEHALVDALVRLRAAKRADNTRPGLPDALVLEEPGGGAKAESGFEENRQRSGPFSLHDFDAVAGAGDLTVGVGSRPLGQEPVDWSFNVGQTTSEGGRFRLLRHHARGGIGDVYVASDSELHREVALKQIQPQHADDPSSRARFLIEAEVTGRLEHPGVVPVYGLGATEQGRPFYAMRFVRGQSLKEAIEGFHQTDLRTPSDPAERTLGLRHLLRRFVDVCNAVAYAHSRGVLHRDLKPANILLGPYGETLVVDWGLAKIVGRDDPTPQPTAERTLRVESLSGSSETQVGTAIGTPAYMSPEQSQGRLARIGPASDIYSLGACLYCIVTGKPPLNQDDLDLLLARLRKGDIKPPRQVNPRVPPALEAVVQKAMAVRPADRYSSARNLAEDVDRWLADEPVLARPEPFRERARRWMRRHRTGVAAMATALTAATFGLAAVLVVQTRANTDLKAANFNLAQANERTKAANRDLELANQRERARFELALEAIKTFHGGVSEDVLLKEKQFSALRTKLLRGATNFYGRLEDLLKEQADRRSRGALGRAYHDIGDLTAKIGSQVEALGALKRGLDLRLALASEVGASNEERLDAGSSLIAVGDVQEATGDLNGALVSYGRAREILAPLAQADPNNARCDALVARCLHGTAVVQYHTGHAADSLASHELTRAIRHKLAANHPEVTEFQSDLALSYHDIGGIHRGGGRAADALASYQRARDINQKLAAAQPEVTQFQSDLAQSYNDLGYVEQETGQLSRALASFEQARAILQRLADKNPAVTRFQADLAQSHQVMGSIHDQTGHPALALASFDRARAILQKLTEADPNVTLFQNRLAMSHSYMGLARQRAGRPAEAAEEFKKAVAIMERLADVQPDGYMLYNLACFRSLLSGIAAEPGSGLTAGDVDSLGQKAVQTLHRAVAAGLEDVAFMRRDTDLDPLRARADFQLLLLDLAFPDDPFAP